MNYNDAAESRLILIFNRCLLNIRPETWARTWKCGSPVVLINPPPPRAGFTRAHYTSSLIKGHECELVWEGPPLQCNTGAASGPRHRTVCGLTDFENAHRIWDLDGQCTHTEACLITDFLKKLTSTFFIHSCSAQ